MLFTRMIIAKIIAIWLNRVQNTWRGTFPFKIWDNYICMFPSTIVTPLHFVQYNLSSLQPLLMEPLKFHTPRAMYYCVHMRFNH